MERSVPLTYGPFLYTGIKSHSDNGTDIYATVKQRKIYRQLAGVRAQESTARAKLSEREKTPEGPEIYRPLINWRVEEVFVIHDNHGIKPNPLYNEGMGRVGFLPCINCTKGELIEIARRYPGEIERIAKWESIVAKASKRGSASFFPHDDVAGKSIYDYVEWSKTSLGGLQYNLEKLIGFDDVPMCSSQYGLCE